MFGFVIFKALYCGEYNSLKLVSCYLSPGHAMSGISVQKLMPLNFLSRISVFSNVYLPKAAILYAIQNYSDFPYFGLAAKCETSPKFRLEMVLQISLPAQVK